ncbi:hypothetical protein COO60DRAFT_578364 [Scenedesmus sp. NREL 46B-D3]|nr:hypothetical protein COO60DRAFT_578364 [Scenedesmus sp. NREL 46B-D3]
MTAGSQQLRCVIKCCCADPVAGSQVMRRAACSCQFNHQVAFWSEAVAAGAFGTAARAAAAMHYVCMCVCGVALAALVVGTGCACQACFSAALQQLLCLITASRCVFVGFSWKQVASWRTPQVLLAGGGV